MILRGRVLEVRGPLELTWTKVSTFFFAEEDYDMMRRIADVALHRTHYMLQQMNLYCDHEFRITDLGSHPEHPTITIDLGYSGYASPSGQQE